MTFSSPFISSSLYWCATKIAQIHGYLEIVTIPHGCKENRQAAATVGALSERAVDLTGRNDRFIVGCTHPIDRSADVMVADIHAVANDHRTLPRPPFAGRNGESLDAT
jgi:hypothetical protein